MSQYLSSDVETTTTNNGAAYASDVYMDDEERELLAQIYKR